MTTQELQYKLTKWMQLEWISHDNYMRSIDLIHSDSSSSPILVSVGDRCVAIERKDEHDMASCDDIWTVYNISRRTLESKPPYTTKGLWEHIDRDVKLAYSFSNLPERRDIARSKYRELLNDYIDHNEILLLL
jgi:hypothetical protein